MTVTSPSPLAGELSESLAIGFTLKTFLNQALSQCVDYRPKIDFLVATPFLERDYIMFPYKFFLTDVTG
ncbi:MAG: hypothetical protein N5P05_003893 [Chroococcopsis gigantea SAG 12.99]|jgi:hypothetical protein|nr:hypothetical protein [Chroococcopsis gigantea SAG 12.99]